ncbi:MAG: flagellin [Hydrogenophilales bacterium CG_4_10_14_3_um_filter_63_21]|nr:MAG: flagellin [Hydrogenophilales bacterium CG_4_10_14_3_um_filter_63_21]
MAIGEIGLTSSMRANLLSLQTTARLLGSTEERLSSGKRVNTAVDNPANFFAAQSHTSRANQLSGLKDNISEAIQTVKAADSGIKGVLTTIEALRGVMTQARSAINDTVNSAVTLGGSATGGASGLTGQYNRLVEQLNNLVTDSSYKGTNFLTSGSVTLTVNFNENATTKIVMSGFNSGASGLAISGGGSSLTVAGTTGNITSGDLSTASSLDAAEATLNSAMATLQTKSSELSANLSSLTARQTFINEMTNTLVVGATKLTEADTNEEGANLLSLQTKNTLGTTALSISNQAQQAILRLF